MGGGITLKISDFLLKWFGHKVADKIDLKEDKDMDTKKWYQSKTIWAATVTGLIGIYNGVASVKGLPPVPEWVYAILGAVGVYTRVNATTKIG